MSSNAFTLVVGDDDQAAVIADRLAQDGRVMRIADLALIRLAAALADPSPLGAVVIVAPPPARTPGFLEISDAQLDESLARFADLFEALGRLIPRLQDGGAAVHVGYRGHLGAWGGAHESAFAGAVAGLMRSVALETMNRGLRANAIAADLPDDPSRVAPADRLSEVAELTAWLASPASQAVNGELLLANRGQSLRIREAKDRRPQISSQKTGDQTP